MAVLAVVVSCLPSFRVLLNTRSSRSGSAYNLRKNYASRTRFGSSSKHAWRLKPVIPGITSFGGSIHCHDGALPTEHFAGAERVDQSDTDTEAGQRVREDGSKEYILPKAPKDGVHVRRDIILNFS